MNLKTFVQGFGAAIIVLILRVWPLLSANHALIYHSFLPMQSMVWGIVIDLVILSVSAALLFSYLQRGEATLRNLIWVLVGAELIPILVTDVAAVWQTSVSYLCVKLLLYGTLLVGFATRWFRPVAYQRVVRGGQVLLLLAGCSLIWMMPELLYIALRAQPRDAQVPMIQAGRPVVQSTRPGAGGRIVWLLFDELSYNQAFEHRVSSLSMPAFDRLRHESVSFSNLQPVGYHTERIVPSFFLGHVVDNIRSNLDGEPSIKLAGQKDWQSFDAHTTLFGDAQRLGWTTGVVGWYNPYCRILAGTLNYCYWRSGDGQWNGTTPDNSAFENAVAPLANMMPDWRHTRGFPQEQKHASDLAAIMPQAETLIRDQSIDFVFIHLPVPHPPGIYDRRPGHQRPTGTYIDNLALADRTLDDLMRIVDATALAPKTTVIVCSDHSWRVPLWRPTPQWSEEEQTASQGRFDPRPVLLIHFPGQSSQQEVTQAFDEGKIHSIIETMLRSQLPHFDKSLMAGAAPSAASARH
ncbi:MAG TPA: sulfatase-like hydrolase/transferase [Acidobacteriaceae bacterium]|jgi:hypothetical protein|nr:sulfatase-like hydrolase/transferase [Acidobacteriaceae bacterium]